MGMRAYSRFVHLSKYTLSISIIVLLVLVVGIPLIGREKEGMRLAFASIEEKEASLPVMIKPKFQGVDSNQQPYFVTAATATQQNNDTITLENVAADLTTEDKAWLALVAEQGILDLGEENLLLQGNVQVYHDGGHEMRTEQVRIDLEKLHAFGESPVQIQGNFGHIKADRFAIFDKGDRMLFNDNVYMLLLP